MKTKALLLVDGLPTSARVKEFTLAVGTEYAVFYCSFVDILSNFKPTTITRTLSKCLEAIAGEYHDFDIIGVSFGGYIVLHSNELLSRYSKNVNQITLYSPVAKMNRVASIDSLPDYLNARYRSSDVGLQDLLLLDEYFTREKLLGGDLRKKTKIILGAKDQQLPVKNLCKYYDGFNVVVTEESHIGISNLIHRKNVEWM